MATFNHVLSFNSINFSVFNHEKKCGSRFLFTELAC